MGISTKGTPLSWDEIKTYAEHVRQHGINQFINIYKKMKNRSDPSFKYGDEIEYMIVKFDHKNKKVRLRLKAKEILDIMEKLEEEQGENRDVLWRPESLNFMIEATPGKPYGDVECGSGAGPLSHFNLIEPNMRIRPQDVKHLLSEDESLITITSFPGLGTKDFTYPLTQANPKTNVIKSQFVADEVIFPSPRCISMAENIGQLRRGRKIAINIPIFKDTNTPDPFVEVFNDEESDTASKVDHIYLDSSAYGMGCCCLQVTFQAANIDEARFLYDQMTPITPIALTLSAASPLYRGYLSDRDCRWSMISAGMDARTKEEMGEQPLKNNKFRINKSRYDSTDSYLSESSAKYNDIPLVYDKKYYQQMIEAGVEPMLAKHIAHLFIRDPLYIMRERLEQNDETEADHFESIQSTNWQNMRFKPPPPQSSIGWRIEFRPMEVQMSPFENAAYTIFIILLSRVILHFKLDLLIPISKVNDNMTEAQKRDAVRRSKFWFRKDIRSEGRPLGTDKCTESNGFSEETPINESCVLMSVNEIVNGKGRQFMGLVPLIKKYLSTVQLDVDTHSTIERSLNLISDRASGRLSTAAKWIRDFVRQHEEYRHDSVVNDRITYDLLVQFDAIQKGDLSIKELGNGDIRNITNKAAKCPGFWVKFTNQNGSK